MPIRFQRLLPIPFAGCEAASVFLISSFCPIHPAALMPPFLDIIEYLSLRRRSRLLFFCTFTPAAQMCSFPEFDKYSFNRGKGNVRAARVEVDKK
jgi:hypothetical protein